MWWWGNEGVDWICTRNTKTACKPEARKSRWRTPLQVSEGAWPYQHHDFRLLASRTWDNTLKPIPFVALCCASPKKRIQQVRGQRKGLVTRRSWRAKPGALSSNRLAGATANRGLPIATHCRHALLPKQQREAGPGKQRLAASGMPERSEADITASLCWQCAREA